MLVLQSAVMDGDGSSGRSVLLQASLSLAGLSESYAVDGCSASRGTDEVSVVGTSEVTAVRAGVDGSRTETAKGSVTGAHRGTT